MSYRDGIDVLAFFVSVFELLRHLSERFGHFRAADEHHLDPFFGFHNYALYNLPDNLVLVCHWVVV